MPKPGALDIARLADIARLQKLQSARGLSADDRFGLFELIAVLLRRHAGSDAGTQAAVDALLAHADATAKIVTPTIQMIIAAASNRSPAHAMTRAAGGKRR